MGFSHKQGAPLEHCVPVSWLLLLFVFVFLLFGIPDSYGHFAQAGYSFGVLCASE